MIYSLTVTDCYLTGYFELFAAELAEKWSPMLARESIIIFSLVMLFIVKPSHLAVNWFTAIGVIIKLQ